MKYTEAAESLTGLPTIELTRRNIEILLAKLDDDLGVRTITKDGHAVRAVEEHVGTGWGLIGSGWAVVPVENDEHYAKENRQPGEMLMPSSGETI